MERRVFSEQIAEAIRQLGAEEAAGCMARSLIFLAHASKNNFEFSCDQGVVSIERLTIPDSSKH